MEKTKISWEQVKELIPERVSLYYVDYRDNLDNQHDIIQECIHKRNKDSLFEKIDEWYEEPPFYAFEYLDKELKQDIERTFDVDEDEAEEIFEEFRDDIRDTYYDRDDSNLLRDLIQNTSKMTMFYDTGYYMESESWCWDEKRVKEEIKNIKKALGIKLKEDRWDKYLNSMIRQASYGGQLVVYFYDDVEDFLEIPEEYNMIRFKNAYIAVINTSCGSGDHCELYGSDFSLPLDVENIFVCKTIKYSYTHEVCGMYSNWCEGTNVYFETKRTRKVTQKSNLNAEIEKDKHFNEVYKKGGCSAGDMDITRHRDIEYINNYPCGNKCKKCGTFWID